MMKRIFTVSIVVLVVLFAVSCKTTQAQVDDAFQKVYNKYHSGLILDGAKSYTVVKGDTLSAIARNEYGTGNGVYFPLIMLASSDVVLDPDLIEPGDKLTVPNLQRNLDDPAARGQLKNFLKEIADVYATKKSRPADADALRVKADSL
jgi:LysM repeat protein